MTCGVRILYQTAFQHDPGISQSMEADREFDDYIAGPKDIIIDPHNA
jgi:hypothetical protein